MTSSLNDLLPHLPTVMLVVFRIGGLLLFAPIYGSQVIPVRVKALLAIGVGVAAYPLLLERGDVVPIASLNLFVLGPLVALEVLFGAVIGFIGTLPLLITQLAGLVTGQQMGLGFARFYNPAVDDEADVVGQVLLFVSLIVFLMMGGHEALLYCVLWSFEATPLGGFTPDVTLLSLIAGLLGAGFNFALRVSAPILAIIFLETVAMGFVAKSVPQLNILSLGFPIRIMGGLLMVALGVFMIEDVVIVGFEDMFDDLQAWLEAPLVAVAQEAVPHG